MDCRHISIGLGLCSSQNCLFYSCFGSSGVSTFTFASLVVQMVVKPTLIAVWSMPAPVGAIALRAHPHLTSLFDRRRYRIVLDATCLELLQSARVLGALFQSPLL